MDIFYLCRLYFNKLGNKTISSLKWRKQMLCGIEVNCKWARRSRASKAAQTPNIFPPFLFSPFQNWWIPLLHALKYVSLDFVFETPLPFLTCSLADPLPPKWPPLLSCPMQERKQAISTSSPLPLSASPTSLTCSFPPVSLLSCISSSSLWAFYIRNICIVSIYKEYIRIYL